MTKGIKNLKIALVHDYLQWYGGAEKVLEALHEIWPDAPVYTSVYNPETMPENLKTWDIRTSFMQKLPRRGRFLKYYSFLYPLAFEQFDFSEYDVVISSSAGFAKGIITKPETCHIAYTHTPPRFQWGFQTSTREKLGQIYTKIILPPIDNYLRIWDQCAAERVDSFIANSREVQKRIQKIYKKDSEIIYPPVDFERFSNCADIKKEDYFVTISRLERYKRIDLLISACNKLGLRLRIIGEGADRQYLESLAGPTIEFSGRLKDEDLIKSICGAKAFLFAADEDFGIVIVEALAAGIPVIALGKGGALEIIDNKKTGEFFYDQSVGSLINALKNFDKKDYKKEDCKKAAQRFSKQLFKKKITAFVEKKYSDYISSY